MNIHCSGWYILRDYATGQSMAGVMDDFGNLVEANTCLAIYSLEG